MKNKLTRNWLNFIFLTGVCGPVATLVVCYFITVIANHSEPFMPFISDLDLFQPEDTIFSIGISISTLAIMAMITIIFGEKRKAISDVGAGRIWGYVNLISYALGILSVAYTFVLAFLPWPEFSPFHGIVARSMFAYGVMWCVIQMVLEWKLGHKFPRYFDELKKRALPVLAVVIGLTGFAYFSLEAIKEDNLSTEGRNWEELRKLARSPETFKAGTLSAKWDLAALFEWIMILSMCATLGTYRTAIIGDLDSEDEELASQSGEGCSL